MIFQRSLRAEFQRRTRTRKMRGFSLVSAIFLLVVLAALGVAMITISTVQHQSSALDVQGTRAYHAARAGVEWGVFQKLQAPAAYCTAAVTDNIALPAGTSLAGFTVTVVCTPDSTLGINTAVIQATACNIPTGGGACPNAASNSSDYVQRVVQVRL